MTNCNKTKLWQQFLQQHRAIAVIRATEFSLGLAVAKAVAAGGIKLIEITWNSEQPEKLIQELKIALPDCQIGTGTIIEEKQLKQAINCGVEFIFSPHTNLKLIETARNANIPIIPGALSPTEIVTAWQAGATCIKVFPIQAVGGANYIKSLQAPLGQIPLIPTGGVTVENALDFLKAGAIAVGLSGDLLPTQLLKNQDWQAISQRATILYQKLTSIKL